MNGDKSFIGVGRGRGRGRGRGKDINSNSFQDRLRCPVPLSQNRNIYNNVGISNAPTQENSASQSEQLRNSLRVDPECASLQETCNTNTVLASVPYQAVGSNSVNRSIFPKRPGYGKSGRPIEVKVNYFPLTLPNGNVYHYDVKIVALNNRCEETSKSLNKQTCRKIIEKLSKTCKDFANCIPAFDGKANLIMRKQLFSNTKDFVVLLDADESNSSKSFKVVITPAKEEPVINLDIIHRFFKGEPVEFPFRAIMALDVIMRTGLNLRLTPVGRSVFYRPDSDDLHPIGGGREIWFGYHQSVRPTSWKMMVNIDRAACVFHEKQFVLDFISKSMKKNISRPLDYYTIKTIEKELKGLKVRVMHQSIRRKYNVIGLTKKPLSEIEFSMDRNNETFNMGVVDYFKEQYKIKLVYDFLPALTVGSKDNPKYLPLEVCEIVEGQPCKKQLNEEQTRKMIFETCQIPHARFKAIEAAARNTVEYNKEFIKEFDLQMNTKCIDVPARILDPPEVIYKNNQITPQFGVWDMKNKKFFSSERIANWILLSTVRTQDCKYYDLEIFKSALRKIAMNVGIEMEEPKITKIVLVTDVVNSLRNYAQKWKLDLAIIVLPNKSSTIYSDIKNMAETEIGLATQCVRENNVKKCKDSVISNLLQKINAKMGGVNCGLSEEKKPDIFKYPVIFLGADVTHPSPGDRTGYSIAAVVGSLDNHPCRYAAAVRIQRPDHDKRRVEIIVQLKEMVKEMLKQFYKHSKQKPEKIVFFRDGVSEGEFGQVQNKEVSQIRQACKEMEDGYEPGITYIVVGKRHHMRMVPTNRRDAVGKAGNVSPGTIVDSGITHPTDFDFFLCSHFGLQGTSRPAHYTVLWDDNDFTSDQLQTLSYYLCHVYARCTRSISIPSPVQYAHLAAARAKQHLISKMDVNGANSGSSGENMDYTIDLELLKVVKNFIHSMYFV